MIYNDPSGNRFNDVTGGGGGNALPAPSGAADPSAMDALLKALFMVAAGIFTGTKAVSDTTTSSKNNNKNVITLYHATSLGAAENIIKKGIDLTIGRENLDFGQGFYVTRDYGQAVDWAQDKFGDAGVILEFTVDAKEFKQFKGLVFQSPSAKWGRYVTLGREGKLTDNYDYIEGPYLKNPQVIGSNKPLSAGGNQIAIRSTKMAKWLIKGISGISS